jgi:hypothetical protein
MKINNSIFLLFFILATSALFAKNTFQCPTDSIDESVNQDLTQYTTYFNKQIGFFNEWLVKEGIDNIIQIDSSKVISVKQDSLTLYLKTPDHNNWKRLDSVVKTELNIHLKQLLFDKFLFLFEVPGENGHLTIDAMDVVILVDEADNMVNTRVFKKMGDISERINIPLNGMNASGKFIFTKGESVAQAKSKIKEVLIGYFKQNEVDSWFEKYAIDVNRARNDNELNVQIQNVKNVVIKSKKYWEMIAIHFYLSEKNNNLAINYTINAKYAAGFESLWAPHDARYQPVENLSSTDWENFRNKFYIDLRDELNKP